MQENTFALLVCRMASTVWWKGSGAEGSVNPGYKGKITWVVVARVAVMTERRDDA